jgi:hypothetical protein
MRPADDGLPLEQFIQALTSQLDRAQETMALKARAGLPLTFAVKDLALDLRTHVEMQDSVVRIRPAGAGDGDASTLRLTLTTITRPMIEENTRVIDETPDEPSLKEVLGDDITDDDARRLEWAGIRTVRQLREVGGRSGVGAIERVAMLPVDRLRAALSRASAPRLGRVVPDRVAMPSDPEPPRLRIGGSNLVQDRVPRVRIGGRPVPVLDASSEEIVVQPAVDQLSGLLEVETAPGEVLSMQLDFAPEPPEISGGAT